MLTLSVCSSVSTEAWTQRDTEGLHQESNQSGVVGMKCAAQRLSWTVCLFSRKHERSRCRLLLSCWTVEANYQRRCSSRTHRDGCDAIQYMQKHMQTRARSRVSPAPPPPLSYLFLFINGGWVKAADSSPYTLPEHDLFIHTKKNNDLLQLPFVHHFNLKNDPRICCRRISSSRMV